MSTKIKTEGIYYAVKLKPRKDEACQMDRLALSAMAGAALFYRRADATIFRNELVPHVGQRGKVVKARVTVEEL